VERRRKELLVFVLPNLFTTINLFFGFFSMVYATKGEWELSALAILLGAFTDGLDGRIARMTNTQSAFGEQYDSMSDLVSFGAAPALLMYLWALVPYGRLGWLAAFFFLTCAALRLTRFNVLKQTGEKRYFQGCPSPVAAGVIAASVLFYGDFVSTPQFRDVFMIIVMFVTAAAMISNVKYRSFKDLNFSSQRGFGLLLVLVATFLVISSSPERWLFPISCAYVFSGPIFSVIRYFRKGRA
jgi:CDP-diacylglycerol---serine O-phosphatidyltransferase